jgi:redox-sensitive bicupin YhaK (pirin superfamily)
MPRGEDDGLLWGFQLWANLPSSGKMMDPRYRGIGKIDIPEIIMPNGTKVKIICGNLDGTEGPVKDIVIDPEYLDVTVPPETVFNHQVKKGHTVFAYVIEGTGHFDENQKLYGAENLVIFDDGDKLSISASGKELRFLLISGRPIGEPVAWYGPIVMNTEDELKLAFEEYQDGTFIKKGTEIDE